MVGEYVARLLHRLWCWHLGPMTEPPLQVGVLLTERRPVRLEVVQGWVVAIPLFGTPYRVDLAREQWLAEH